MVLIDTLGRGLKEFRLPLQSIEWQGETRVPGAWCFFLLLFVFSCRPPAAPETLIGRGTVQQVVVNDRRIVIAHEDMPGFMPAMTMSFEVKNPALLTEVTQGDYVRFVLERTDQTLYLVAVEKEEQQGKTVEP
jgi:Cu/Ag efflux protein CusF